MYSYEQLCCSLDTHAFHLLSPYHLTPHDSRLSPFLIPRLPMFPQYILNVALGVEAIHGFEQQFADFVRIIIFACLLELFQQPLDIAPRQGLLLGAHDAGMVSGEGVLANQQLLVKLFSRSQAGKLDLDIAIRWIPALPAP